MLKFISVADFLKARGVIVDVRSESEFVEAHVPSATSVPLLSDAERAEVGTLFKKEGGERARTRGLEIVRPKLKNLFEQLANKLPEPERRWVHEPSSTELEQAFQIVASRLTELSSPNVTWPARVLCQPPPVGIFPMTFYCWRGGARSRSLAIFANALGFNVTVLSGGHKAFRRGAQEFLNQENYPFKFCTLYGLTGAGKTKILRQWLDEGKPVVDLEALAHHRGSAFGQIGIDSLGRQTDFENNLFWELERLAALKSPVIVIEGESQRIGLCRLSDSFMKAMLSGYHVLVNTPVEERVNNILRDYVEPVGETRMLNEARRALEVIKKHLGDQRCRELGQLLNEKNYPEFTRRLLVEYYDKRYAFARAPSDFYHGEIKSVEDWIRLPFVLP